MNRSPRPRPRNASSPAPSLPVHLRRRRWRRRGVAALVIAALVGLAVADHRGWLLHRGDDLSRYQGRRARVRRVIDGDTLEVNVPDGEEPTTTVRLWGIDAPEAADPRTGKTAEPFAKQATRAAKRLASGRTITLHLEPHRVRGVYKRVLAYVELPDGSRLAERLLEQGLATFDDRFRHRRYRRYRLIEEQARTRREGMWAEDYRNDK